MMKMALVNKIESNSLSTGPTHLLKCRRSNNVKPISISHFFLFLLYYFFQRHNNVDRIIETRQRWRYLLSTSTMFM